MKQAIGFLDSGVGGLSVVKEALKVFPNEDLVFIGDNARTPYGIRPKEQIKAFTDELIAFLRTQDIKALVVACNTVSAVYLDELKKTLDLPVIGMITAGAEGAIQTTKTKKVAVIATKVTIKSKAYVKEIKRYGEDYEVFDFPTSELVGVAERPELVGTEVLPIIERNLAPLLETMKKEDIDTLVLGCTHFPRLAKYIQEVVGDKIQLVDPGVYVVRTFKERLHDQQLETKEKGSRQVQLYTTGETSTFDTIVCSWLDVPLKSKHVEVEEA